MYVVSCGINQNKDDLTEIKTNTEQPCSHFLCEQECKCKICGK